MKDIHSHLIYGVDDGSKSLEESIKKKKKMEKAGTTDLMLTPHYVEKSKFSCNNKCKKEIFNKLKESAEKENININLYYGNEVKLPCNNTPILRYSAAISGHFKNFEYLSG